MNQSATLLTGFLLLSALVAFSLLSRRYLSGRFWRLFRVFFPSWQFFEDINWVPQLWFRVLDESVATWHLAVPREARPFFSIFINPRGNLRMAKNSLIEQFAEDLAESSDGARISEMTSYRLVENLVRFEIREKKLVSSRAKFQFKLVAVTPGSEAKDVGEELMLSSEHEV